MEGFSFNPGPAAGARSQVEACVPGEGGVTEEGGKGRSGVWGVRILYEEGTVTEHHHRHVAHACTLSMRAHVWPSPSGYES